jgi:hypothetical protein
MHGHVSSVAELSPLISSKPRLLTVNVCTFFLFPLCTMPPKKRQKTAKDSSAPTKEREDEQEEQQAESSTAQQKKSNDDSGEPTLRNVGVRA